MQTITPRRYRQLQPEDRVTMASLLQLNHSLRDIANVLKRSPSTISQEQRRNSDMNVPAVVHSPYSSATAQSKCRQRRRAGRPLAKLHTDRPMFEVVRRSLGLCWSPEQIALTLAALYPKGHGYRVSTETTYNCINAQAVGELKRELVACLRRQRGSNENMNGLVRQYPPKGTDLAGYSQEQLDAIANEINNRQRKGLGVRSPLAVYTELLLNSPQHSPIETRVLHFTFESTLYYGSNTNYI
jgi:IS30 family transposase